MTTTIPIGTSRSEESRIYRAQARKQYRIPRRFSIESVVATAGGNVEGAIACWWNGGYPKRVGYGCCERGL